MRLANIIRPGACFCIYKVRELTVKIVYIAPGYKENGGFEDEVMNPPRLKSDCHGQSALRTNPDAFVQRPRLIDVAVFDNKRHAPYVADAFGRIPVNQNQIGEPARRD